MRDSPTRDPNHVARALVYIDCALEDLACIWEDLPAESPLVGPAHAAALALGEARAKLGPLKAAEVARVLPAPDAGMHYAHSATAFFAAAAARSAAYGTNYVELRVSDPVEGPLVVTVQRAGKVAPAEGRRAAEEHALALAARLRDLGHDPGPLPATFLPDPTAPLGPEAPPVDPHPHVRLRVDATPWRVFCSACGAEDELPAAASPGALQGAAEGFAADHAGCAPAHASPAPEEAP